MSLKNDILLYLVRETQSLNLDNLTEKYTANTIAEHFNVKRNTASHYLNQLVEEFKVIKINTRPVYFFSKNIFEKMFFHLSECIFESIEDIKSNQSEGAKKKDIFDQVIGVEGSLKKNIAQIKASIFYPDGLPLIIFGPTGIGKSYTAELIYRYCVEKGVLKENAPFVNFNCAQYVNNPELLSSNLFGFVKGAFTGALSTKEGMLEAANGGILFLDEVHRLNPESQEKLFTFMDRGEYRRMGESKGYHTANVRLIFATTEQLEENFLQTFLRRIPIRVTMPSLHERGEKEKKQFVYMFLIDEAKKIHLPIRITNQALDALIKHNYSGNTGELKNVIKYIVASALSKERDAKEVNVTLHDIPDNILENTIRDIGTRVKNHKDIMISEESTLGQLYEESVSHLQPIKKTYEKVLTLFNEIVEKCYSLDFFKNNISKEVNALFDQLIFNVSEESRDVMLDITMANIQESIEYLEKNYSVKFNGNNIYLIAYFMYYKGTTTFHWSKSQKVLIQKLSSLLETSYDDEKLLVKYIGKNLSNKLHIQLERLDEILLWVYLKNSKVNHKKSQAKAIILAHGYATASSMANVANRFLGTNIFESFDMPLDISTEETAAKVINYMENNDVSKGLAILVDMGSLEDIDVLIKDNIKGPVTIINNVSTQMVLYLGEMINKEILLEEMIKNLTEKIQIDSKIIYPKREKEKVIITSCQTGLGTALQIQMLLEKSIPNDLGIKIVAHDYNRLKELGIQEGIFQTYDIIAISGTADPMVEDIPYISLEDLISGSGVDKLRDILFPFVSEDSLVEINNKIVWNCSLERVIDSITILDSEKILSYSESFVNGLEIRLKRRISNKVKIALYVHTSCLVERLIRKTPIENYPNLETFEQCQRESIKIVKEAFSVIEDVYNVKINLSETAYIYDYIAEDSFN